MIKKLLPLLILSGLIIFFFFRLFYPTQSIFMIPDFGESDVLHFNLPLKYILSSSLKNHEWPLWSPYLANGFPVLAEGQIGTFYLPNLLLFRFLPLVWAYNLNLVIAYILAALGTYLFARTLKFSTIASFFVSFIFTFSGFLSVHLNHFDLIQSASLLPLIFWASYLLWQKPNFKFSVLFAFLLSQQIFSGHFYIVFITLVGVILFWIGQIMFGKKDSFATILRKQVVFILFAFVLTFFLSAVQLLPTIELWQLSERQSGLDFSSVTDYPFQIKNLLTFIKPYAFGNPANGTYPPFSTDWGIFWENTGYVGLLPLFLAASSLIFLRHKRVKIFLSLLLVSLLLVLGRNSPLYFIFAIFPFNLFRVPSKYLLLTTFSLAILASYGFDKLIIFLLQLVRRIKTFSSSEIHIITFIFAGIFFLLLLIDEYKFSYNYPPATPADWWVTPPEITQIVKAGDRISSADAPYLWNIVFEKNGWQDFRPYLYFKNSLYPNYNVLFSIGQADVNTGGLIPRRLSLFTALTKNIDIDMDNKVASVSSTVTNELSLAGVSFFISPYKINNASLIYKTSLSAPKNLRLEPFLVYQNNGVRPRNYLTTESTRIETLEDYNIILSDKNFLQNNSVMVEDDALKINNTGKALEQVNITTAKSTEITLEASSPTPAILVDTDTNYPGWKAYVDGVETKIYNVNLVQRGILFPKGHHQIKFIFISTSFELGKQITLFSWLIISLAVFLFSSGWNRKVSGNKRLERDL